MWFSQPHLLKIKYSWVSVKYKLTLFVRIYFWALCHSHSLFLSPSCAPHGSILWGNGPLWQCPVQVGNQVLTHKLCVSQWEDSEASGAEEDLPWPSAVLTRRRGDTGEVKLSSSPSPMHPN